MEPQPCRPDQDARTKRSCRPWLRRRWKSLAALLLLGLFGYGVCWWQVPKRMRVVTHVTFEYPEYPSTVTVCAQGYLFKDVFYDWRGKERWRLGQAPAASFPTEPPSDRYTRATASETAEAKRQLLESIGHAVRPSPSGEYLARAIVDGHHTRLQLFRHGKLITDRRLPLDLAPYYTLEWMPWIGLQVHDDGTVWAGLRGSAQNSPVYVVKEDRIVATGTLPRGTHGLSPDARFYVPYNDDNRYYPITLQDKRVVLSPGIAHPYGPHILLYDGAFINGDNMLYREAGKASGERIIPLGNSLRYLVYETPTVIGIYNPTTGIRIYNPTTGEFWLCAVDGGVLAGYATDDGRHAVLLVTGGRPGRISRLVEQYLPGVYQQYLAKRGEKHTYIIYERPGKILARYPLRKGPSDCSPTAYLSPDGRAMLLLHNIHYSCGDSPPNSYYTLLRW